MGRNEEEDDVDGATAIAPLSRAGWFVVARTGTSYLSLRLARDKQSREICSRWKKIAIFVWHP